MESDIRENGLIDTWRFNANSDREVYMRKCEESRVTKLYEHGQCSESGLKKGIIMKHVILVNGNFALNTATNSKLSIMKCSLAFMLSLILL